VTRIFLAACDLSGDSRRRTLDLLCSEYPSLRPEIEELLSIHDAENTSSGTPFGIPSAGEIPWGSHVCHFYRSRGDLVESLVPYFRTGLENGERCIWVTAEPLRAADATAELVRVMPGVDRLLEERRIRILDSETWYAGLDQTRQESLVDAWLGEEKEAALEGCTGLRVAGNVSFVQREASFLEYERAVNRIFPSRQIVAVCSYDLGRCDPSDFLNVLRSHRFTLGRTDRGWEIAEPFRASGHA
jgi:hypothetical protein